MKYCVLCLQLKHIKILRSVSTTETHEILRSVSTTEHEILRSRIYNRNISNLRSVSTTEIHEILRSVSTTGTH